MSHVRDVSVIYNPAVSANDMYDFTYNRSLKKIQTNEFKPELFSYTVPTREILTFFEPINEHFKHHDRFFYYRYVIMYGMLIAITLIITYQLDSRGYRTKILSFPILEIGWIISICLIFLCLIHMICKYRNRYTRLRENLEKYLASRQIEYSIRGLRWVIPSDFPRAIILKKDPNFDMLCSRVRREQIEGRGDYQDQSKLEIQHLQDEIFLNP